MRASSIIFIALLLSALQVAIYVHAKTNGFDEGRAIGFDEGLAEGEEACKCGMLAFVSDPTE